MDSGPPLKLATRGSELALTQANGIAESLHQLGVSTTLEIVKTTGDLSSADRFVDIGPQGVFAREIELALIEHRADIAVHSCKDLPTRSPEGLCIGAIPPRADAHDVLLIRKDALALQSDEPLAPLARDAKVGTSSARRQSWLQHFRHDLNVVPLRGNVPTRIARLRDGDYDAILLAAAGLDRLSAAENLLAPLLADLTLFPLDMNLFVPAPAQGALAIQCRAEDKNIRDLLARINDRYSHECVATERAALTHADGGCELAFGAYCHRENDELSLTCMLERNGQVHTVTCSGSEPANLGTQAWQALEREFAGE